MALVPEQLGALLSARSQRHAVASPCFSKYPHQVDTMGKALLSQSCEIPCRTRELLNIREGNESSYQLCWLPQTNTLESRMTNADIHSPHCICLAKAVGLISML